MGLVLQRLLSGRPGVAAVFALEFAALDLVAPEKNQFTHKLEGFDTDWSPPSTRNSPCSSSKTSRR